MMATPPGSTGARFGRRPAMRSGSAFSCLISRLLSLSRPSRVSPSAANPFSRRMFSIERAVPEEPTASSQPGVRGSCSHQRGELLARGELGRLHARLVDPAFGKVLQAEADAAHVQRLGELRLEAGADDELGRAAADVDHQAPLRGCGQRVRNAEVDEARFLAARRSPRSESRARRAPRAGTAASSSPRAARWCRPRAPPGAGSRAGARRTWRALPARAPGWRGRCASRRSGPRPGAPPRAPSRADRSGRRPRGRSAGGSCSSRGRPRRACRGAPSALS